MRAHVLLVLLATADALLLSGNGSSRRAKLRELARLAAGEKSFQFDQPADPRRLAAAVRSGCSQRLFATAVRDGCIAKVGLAGTAVRTS